MSFNVKYPVCKDGMGLIFIITMKKLFYLFGVCVLLLFPFSADAKQQLPDDPQTMCLMMPDGEVLYFDHVLTDAEILEYYARWERNHEGR